MSKPELDSYNGAGITNVIHFALKIGMQVANAENAGDLVEVDRLRRIFNERLAEMPRNSLGGFYIFGDVAVMAYTQGYLKSTNFTM